MQTLYMLEDSFWDKVCTIIEPKLRRRKVALRIIFSGIVYLIQNGCKWRALPPQYGNYKLVWYYFKRWTELGILERLLKELSLEVRRHQGRQAAPSRVIVDSQSAKSAAGTSQQTGYDGGKRLKGRKRHIAVDTQGNILSAGVSSALVSDKAGVRLLQRDVEGLHSVRQVVADYAYRGVPPFTGGGSIQWLIVRRPLKAGFRHMPVRWVVERTFAWLMNYRRLSRDYEKTTRMSQAVMLMAAIHITLKKLKT